MYFEQLRCENNVDRIQTEQLDSGDRTTSGDELVGSVLTTTMNTGSFDAVTWTASTEFRRRNCLDERQTGEMLSELTENVQNDDEQELRCFFLTNKSFDEQEPSGRMTGEL